MTEATVDGRAVTYRMGGSGAPTIVLIAGSGCDHTHFSSVFEALAELRTTVAYDRGGLGTSAPLEGGGDGLRWRTQELRGLLDAIQAPQPYVLAGHSFGALIAQLFAVDYPEDVVGIVSIDGDDGIPPDLPAWPEFPPEIELQAVEKLFESVPPSVRRPVPPLPEHMAAMMSDSADREAGLERLGAARRGGVLPDVPFVQIGAMDHFFGPPDLAPVDSATIKAKLVEKNERTAAAYPRGRFVEASKSGHYIQFDEPELVVGCIAEVLPSRP